MRRVVVVLAVVVLAACGSETQTGSGQLLDFDAQGNPVRVGEATPTPEPTATPDAAAQAAQPAQQQAAAQQAAKATPTPPAAVEIKVNGDQSGKRPFDPPVLRVFAGTTVRWRNNDTVPRSVVADNGYFISPDIAPGGTWDFVMQVDGVFAYADGTRPYATGRVEVQAR